MLKNWRSQLNKLPLQWLDRGLSIFPQLSSPLFIVILLSFVTADIASIYLARLFFPKNLVLPHSVSIYKLPQKTSLQLKTDKLFHFSWSDTPLLTLKELQEQNTITQKKMKINSNTDPFALAKLTSLPLQLKGTIVHANQKLSVASISYGQERYKAFIPGEKAYNMAEVLKIVRKKVFIKNLSNKKIEFIHFDKLEETPSLPVKEVSTPKKQGSYGFVKKDNSTYEIKKNDILKHTSNLRSILNEAQVVPHMKNDKLAGFRFIYVEKDGFFDQLGFQENDLIISVNGQKINSAAQATELYAGLQGDILNKGQPLRVIIERNGARQTINYQVKK